MRVIRLASSAGTGQWGQVARAGLVAANAVVFAKIRLRSRSVEIEGVPSVTFWCDYVGVERGVQRRMGQVVSVVDHQHWLAVL